MCLLRARSPKLATLFLAVVPRNCWTQRKQGSRRTSSALRTEAAFGGARTKAPPQQYICKDCGWIYDGRQSFDSLDKSYRCPVCNSPKRRSALSKRVLWIQSQASKLASQYVMQRSSKSHSRCKMYMTGRWLFNLLPNNSQVDSILRQNMQEVICQQMSSFFLRHTAQHKWQNFLFLAR